MTSTAATIIPSDRPAALAPLAVLGDTWARDIERHDYDPPTVDESLELCGDGLYRGDDPLSGCGLTLHEALGLTLAVAWADEAHDAAKAYQHPVMVASQTVRGRPLWRVRLPTVGTERLMTSGEARELAQALLDVRRIVWPSQPWRPRDPIAEQLERALRAMDADLRGPTPVQVLTPAVIPSDIGRNWS